MINKPLMFDLSPLEFHARDAQRGLSLIEVMVAMAVGVLLLVALGSMLIGSDRSFKIQDNFARMQDNGSYALNSIGRSIRMAGFFGYATGGTLFGGALSGNLDDSNNPCGGNWIINNAGAASAGIEAINGRNGLTSATVNAAMGCISSANFRSNSPILIMRGGDGIPVAPASLQGNRVYIQSDATTSIVFPGVKYATMGDETKRWVYDSTGAVVEAPIFEYQSYAYYVRPCSRPTGGGGATCQATDDNGRPIPTLVRQSISTVAANKPGMVEQSVAEGIEQINVLYGIDANSNNVANTSRDGVPEQFVAAPTALQWPLVVAVRIAVLVRSPNRQHDYDDSGKSYDLGGGVTYTCAGDDCRYHRHVFAQTFQVRNLAQRAGQAI